MDSGSPLILFLIIKLLELIGYTFSIICLPITLYCKLVLLIVAQESSIKESKGFHLFIALPRLLLVLPFFPWSFLALSGLYGWLISLAIKDGRLFIPFVIGLGALAVNIIGFIFTCYKFPSVKPKFGAYFKQVLEALADLFAFIAFVLSLATFIRVPFMIYTVFSAPYEGPTRKKKTVRKQLYTHMALILPDLLCLPLLLIEMLFFWRFKSLRTHAHNKSVVFSFQLRFLIVLEFFKLFWDFFVIMCSILLLLVPYRIPIAFRKARASKTMDDAMLKIMKQVLWALLDLLVILLYVLFIVSTLYRIYISIKKIKGQTRASDRRWKVFEQIGLVFLDLFMLFCSLFIVITVYRIPITYRKLRLDNANNFQITIIKQWLKLMRDIPFIVMGMFVTLLVWRAFFMWRDIGAERRHSRKRLMAAKHFGMLFVDILDLPFVLCSLVILVTVWRSYFFIVEFPTGVSRWRQRAYVMKTFLKLIMDIPTAIGFLILMATVYRARDTIRMLKTARIFTAERPTSKSSSSGAELEISAPSSTNSSVQSMEMGDPEDNPAPTTTLATAALSCHLIIGKQFFLLIVDIPFPLLMLLTLWRLPIVIRRMGELDDPDRKYAQRRLLILRYLLFVLLDLLCLIPVLFILLTMWRIPSFIKMVKEYKRGDNEHRDIAKLFQKTLMDLPFVLLGIMTLIFPWRGVNLIKAVYRESKSDYEARMLALQYFAVLFIDMLCFLCMIFICLGPWRIRTAIKLYREELEPQSTNRWKHTYAFCIACLCGVALILIDVLAVIQTFFITLLAWRVPITISAIKKGKKEQDEKQKPFGTAELYAYISFYFLETLRDIPHLVFAPLKLVGLVFLPLHYYLSKRTQSPTNSFLNIPLKWLHELSVQCMTYLEFDKFATINIIGAVISVPNELGFALVGINAIYMFIVTLGSPLWNKKRIEFNWEQLGQAQGPMVIPEYIIVILQTLLFPVFLAMQLILLILPLLVALGAYQNPRQSFVDYWHSLFTDRQWWRDTVGEFSAGIWVAQGVWVLVMLVCWNVTVLVSRKHFPLFSPWRAYYWLVKKVFVGRVWGLYKQLLASLTYVCFRLRRACFVGEILMFPLFLIWTCWPLIIPIVTKIYYLFIPFGLLTLFLVVMSYRIIKESWGEPIPVDATPKVVLTGVFVDILETGGIVFTFEGVKDPLFAIRDARLSFVGDEIWKCIESAIGKTKLRAALMLTSYPISLCPQFLDISLVNAATSNITFKLNIGLQGSGLLIKKKILIRTIENIMKHGNPTFDFVIEYGKTDFGWKKHGILCQYNTSLSIILEAGLDQSAANHAIPVPQMEISVIPNHSPPPIAPPLPSALKNPTRVQRTTSTAPPVQLNESMDPDLRLAIELSLAEEQSRQQQQNNNDNSNQTLDESDDKVFFKNLKDSIQREHVNSHSRSNSNSSSSSSDGNKHVKFEEEEEVDDDDIKNIITTEQSTSSLNINDEDQQQQQSTVSDDIIEAEPLPTQTHNIEEPVNLANDNDDLSSNSSSSSR
ncbi:hypothetical protein SAMD00019534_092710 [Acytostelium subglobosum LB1]|uniref:hypothetical protein n=1 Tax=Acytostelium subglobosum LB1 TaxID=1410327 RepID=UPI000644E7C2|nr:hypothetical protein SAMD00019534_092710 [Acytostelium subglobosum LB1]GAM26096.1 hypothetical protein SAMD00019534_092710 [Acytostelium subglobosum LB1]|eukprot:XP_012751139.1 hypothetical protein SAMD00019534_092710 [Acytostelium subglobosum LB1]